MSVIHLTANHVYAVAVGVTKLLNNVPAVNPAGKPPPV